MTTGLMQDVPVHSASASLTGKDLFRARFQRALRNCVRRRFSVDESFGVIWLETLEEVSLAEEEQVELYEELILWAKCRLFSELMEAAKCCGR